MKPKIAIFGLPRRTDAQINTYVYANSDGRSFGDEIFRASNNETGEVIGYASADVSIGSTLTIQILSSGIRNYAHAMEYRGGDISHVPQFTKEDHVDEKSVAKDWDLAYWRRWNPHVDYQIGREKEGQLLRARDISVEPIWESYYRDSGIDYFEKFQKLWIGFNAYASIFSNERGDRKRILSLVNSDLQPQFRSTLSGITNDESAERFKVLHHATGLNMSSNIVRDEIAAESSILDFLENAKKGHQIFDDLALELAGTVFLRSEAGSDVFQNIFLLYHEYMASEEGIVQPFDLSEAFRAPRAPESVTRVGRLIFHDPFSQNEPGNLFCLSDYFGEEYADHPYSGQADPTLQEWERVDPLFFRYLHMLYKFRCALFHGDLPPNTQNNEIARTAYLSLYELFPAIL